MRGAVPEDKGDKKPDLSCHVNLQYYWQPNHITAHVVFKANISHDGNKVFAASSLSSFYLVEKLHLNQDFKPLP